MCYCCVYLHAPVKHLFTFGGKESRAISKDVIFLIFSPDFKKKFFAAEACNFIKKESLAQVFSCEFSEISKNTFSYKTPLVAACLITQS